MTLSDVVENSGADVLCTGKGDGSAGAIQAIDF